MSQLIQVLLDKEECSKVLAQHVAAQLPPGTKFIADVVFWGAPPDSHKRPAADFKQMLRAKYLGANEKKDEDLRLLQVGAIVTLHPPAPTAE
jgi:hypothetical protein